MIRLLTSRPFPIIIAVVLIGIALFLVQALLREPDTAAVTTTVELGSVRELVSVSGVTEAKQAAKLAFPVTGTVREVSVDTGTSVTRGTVLATLDRRALYADRADAEAALATAIANRDELIAGPTVTARSATAETVATKQAALATTRETEERKVANAYQTFLSADLAAYAVDPEETAPAPTVTGTYTCQEEGVYRIEAFNSDTDSGYSYRFAGLESGTRPITTQQPAPLGACGLLLQFDEDGRYGQTSWRIPVPNNQANDYVTNRNAYTLAVTQAESAIALAEQELEAAKASETNVNAPARPEAIVRADAAVAQARARLDRIDAAIADRTLTAPFAGIITNVEIVPGETVTTAPIITLLANEQFELIARVPEIDIGKLEVGQTAEMLFDAKPSEPLIGDVTFISPEATEIDGVAYYETIITFRDLPTWMRSGLNADLDIVVQEATSTLRVPKRFVTETETGHLVHVQRDDTIATTTVQLTLEGNDGYVAITGVTAGDTVVAP